MSGRFIRVSISRREEPSKCPFSAAATRAVLPVFVSRLSMVPGAGRDSRKIWPNKLVSPLQAASNKGELGFGDDCRLSGGTPKLVWEDVCV